MLTVRMKAVRLACRGDERHVQKFLSQFLPALTAELDKLGIADKCYFHISDEPSVSPEKPDYENYLAAKEFVAPLLKGCKIMDALSHVEFYDNGLIEYPVCSTNHLAPFMEREIKERWCYYCCSQGDKVANRFLQCRLTATVSAVFSCMSAIWSDFCSGDLIFITC